MPLAPLTSYFRLRYGVMFPQRRHCQRPRVSLWLGDRPAFPWWCLLHWNTQSRLLPLHHPRPNTQKPLVLRHTVWGEVYCHSDLFLVSNRIILIFKMQHEPIVKKTFWLMKRSLRRADKPEVIKRSTVRIQFTTCFFQFQLLLSTFI